MTDATLSANEKGPVLAPDGKPVGKKLIIAWEFGAFVFIMLVASALHFAYELSGFQLWATFFGSVNESTAEHLKLFFWPALIFAIVQHAYTRHRVNNFWWAKAVAIVVAPLVLMLSFYFYLGISLPMYGRGFLWADIGTGALGVFVGNLLTYHIMTQPPMSKTLRNVAAGVIAVLTIHVATMAHVQPKFFIYEDFFKYTYKGDFGILPDYTDYLIFKTPEEYAAIEAAAGGEMSEGATEETTVEATN